MKKQILSSALFACAIALPVNGTVVITEWMYNGSEFVEFTNIGATSVDLTGWSFDDSSDTPGSFDLSAFGTVAPGESVILSEVSEAEFRSLWNLSAAVKVIGGNSQNLGRGDEINLYDALGTLVDRLTYGDQDIPGSIRTEGSASSPASGVADPSNYGANNVLGWRFSEIEDGLSFESNPIAPDNFRLIGSPGAALVPEPSAALLGGFGLLGLLRRRR